MNIFRGRIAPSQILPYPEVLNAEHREMLQMILPPTEKFFLEVNDADKNDANASIDPKVLAKFAELGAFGLWQFNPHVSYKCSSGAVVPSEYEGAGMNNTQMARLAEIVGAHDLAIGVTMGAHQSIGYKGILLVGNEQQKRTYLPDLASGRKFAAFCLTEPGSGSDANVSVCVRATHLRMICSRFAPVPRCPTTANTTF